MRTKLGVKGMKKRGKGKKKKTIMFEDDPLVSQPGVNFFSVEPATDYGTKANFTNNQVEISVSQKTATCKERK